MRATVLLPLLLASPLLAQDVEALVVEGDSVPGVGQVTRIDNLAVNSSGTWIVEADTDNSDTNADSIVLRDGTLYLQEGQSLPQPAGALLDSFDAIGINDNGDSGWNFFLDGTTGGSDDSGVYFGTSLLIQESDIATAPELSPGTPYIGFFEARVNDANQVIVLASVDDPAIASSVDRSFVRIDLDGAGVPTGQTALYSEGDVLPGQVLPVKDFDTAPHNFAWNDDGDLLFLVEFEGSTTVDAIYLNDTVVAQEGQPSPVAGRNWSSLGSPELDLSNNGDVVFNGSLDGDTASNSVIVAGGQVVAQEGSGHPDIPPGSTFISFGSAPVHISDSGEVLFWARWNNASTSTDEGLFLGGELIVQEGVTLVGGVLLDKIASVQDTSSMSDDGRVIVFEGELAGGLNGAFRYDRAKGLESYPGCSPFVTNPATLAYAGGTTRIGDTLTLQLDDVPATLTSPTFLALSPSFPPGFTPPCGIPLTGIGEVMVDFILSPPLIVPGSPWPGAPVQFALPLPPNPGLVGNPVFAQGLTLDFAAAAVTLSNGIQFVVQPA